MDVPRQRSGRRKVTVAALTLAAALVAIPLIVWGWGRLQPAPPPVDRASVWIDSVKRGDMVREVRGLGALVPEEILWIPSTTEGRVEKILVRPGARVRKNTVLMVLSNPQLENDALDALYQLKAAEAALTDLKVKLESARLQQQASTAQLKSDYSLAQMEAEKQETLAKLGLQAAITAQVARAKAEELANRYRIEQKRLEISEESIRAQLAAQQVQVEKLRALHKLRRSQVEQLKVRAGAEGVLQQVPVEVGQKLAAGTVLAKVSQPSRLKAELKISETQAKDVAIGLPVKVDTRNGVIPGRVSRIDPASVNGTVTVDVRLEGSLPGGARPDLSVDGTIEIERLRDTLYIGKPATAQPNSVVTLFKLDSAGKLAHRVQVRLGKASVNQIEVLEGLQAGDRVILSDMTQYDSHSVIRLN
jgi:HlyD family secretion protein